MLVILKKLVQTRHFFNLWYMSSSSSTTVNCFDHWPRITSVGSWIAIVNIGYIFLSHVYFTLHLHLKPPCLGHLHCYLPNSQIFLNLKLPSNWYPSCSSKILWWTLGLAKMLNELVVSTLFSILFEALMPSITILIRSHCGDKLLWNSSAPFWKSSLGGIMVNQQQHRLDAYEANTEMWEYILPTHSWGCLHVDSQNATIHFPY